MIRIHTDGGSRGNPGPAAYGVFVDDESGEKLAGFGKAIGITTNNVAEYEGVIAALTWLGEHKNDLKDQTVMFYLDSELVVKQLGGMYKVKQPHLQEKLFAIQRLQAELNLSISFTHVPREQNKEADWYVNQALDNAS